MKIIKVTSSNFLVKLEEAKKLKVEGKQVVILAEDIDDLLTFFDSDKIAELIQDIPFYYTENE